MLVSFSSLKKNSKDLVHQKKKKYKSALFYTSVEFVLKL